MTKKLAKAGAQSCGINMDVECAWIGPPDQDGFTPFGPDPKKDNIFQNMPQVVECVNVMCNFKPHCANHYRLTCMAWTRDLP